MRFKLSSYGQGLLFAVLCCGCWQPREVRQLGFQGPPPKVPNTETISKFMGRDGMVELYMNFDEIERSTAGARSAVTQPKFLELYEAFKSETLPKEFDSAERQEAKTELVASLDALIEGVKKKANDQEIRTLVEPVRPAAEAFMRPTNY